jgi:hypothetical protein
LIIKLPREYGSLEFNTKVHLLKNQEQHRPHRRVRHGRDLRHKFLPANRGSRFFIFFRREFGKALHTTNPLESLRKNLTKFVLSRYPER